MEPEAASSTDANAPTVDGDATSDDATHAEAPTAPPQRTGGRLPGWAPYTALRILFFLVPMVLIYGFGRNLIVAGVAATLIGCCLSVIFLNRQRAALAIDIDAIARGGRRPAAPPTDESQEDAALDN